MMGRSVRRQGSSLPIIDVQNAALGLLAPADIEKHGRDYEKDYPKERHPSQEMIL